MKNVVWFFELKKKIKKLKLKINFHETLNQNIRPTKKKKKEI